MRFPNQHVLADPEYLLDAYHHVLKVGKTYYLFLRKQYPDICFELIYINFINWMNAILNDPEPTPGVPFSKYCTRHGFDPDMIGAVTEFISQCNMLSIQGGVVEFAETEHTQKVLKIDYMLNNDTIQVKNVRMFSRIEICENWITGDTALWHSFPDVDSGVHIMVRTADLISLIESTSRRVFTEDLIDLANQSGYYFDNSHIFHWSSGHLPYFSI